MVLAGWKLFFRRAFAHFFAGKGGKFLPEFIVCGACHLGAFGVCGLQTIQQHINIPNLRLVPIFNLKVIKNKTFLPFQSFANFIKKKKKYSKTL